MKVLVIGGGGREHAIVHKLSQSKKINKMYCAPGNAGIAKLAQLVPIASTSLTELLAFAKSESIDLTVVGNDDPLVMGIVDLFESNGMRIFGPRKNAAEIEGSKVFSKRFMVENNIPTAEYQVFNVYENAITYIENKFSSHIESEFSTANKNGFSTDMKPLCVKADGLTLGKGVYICKNVSEATNALSEIMLNKKFGESGASVVIEECLAGPEVSVLCFCDGDTIVPMLSAQDHKRSKDGNQGVNTGGMGAISPSPYYSDELAELCNRTIFKPTLSAMKGCGRMFKGVLFVQLMLTERGPCVIEYNCRFGDPETQAVLPLLKTDLVDILSACIDGRLDTVNIEWENMKSVCVVLASDGYPIEYKKGFALEDNNEPTSDTRVYHAGTMQKDGQVVTNGGRVVCAVGLDANYRSAREKAYACADKIKFENKYSRSDIAAGLS